MSKYKEKKAKGKGPKFQPTRTVETQEKAHLQRALRRRKRKEGKNS